MDRPAVAYTGYRYEHNVVLILVCAADFGPAETVGESEISCATTTGQRGRSLVANTLAHQIKVDLDDRAFLFLAGKSINQLLFLLDHRMIFVEAVNPFNQSHTSGLSRLIVKMPGNRRL